MSNKITIAIIFLQFIFSSNLRNYYQGLEIDELQLQEQHLRKGQICCALFLNIWHRGEIVSVDLNDKVKVFFVDYGTTAEIDIKNIKYLDIKFSKIPSQVFRGSLAFIKPVGHRWCRDASKRFLSIVLDNLIYAKATEIDYEVNEV